MVHGVTVEKVILWAAGLLLFDFTTQTPREGGGKMTR